MNHPPPSSLPVNGFEQRLADVRNRMRNACLRTGRDPEDVRLLPVSKTVSVERLQPAIAAGCRELGENRVQEAMGKASALRGLGLRWSIIGHIQSNKAKLVTRFAHELQSLENLKVARLLDRHLQTQTRVMDVYVQVDSTTEGATVVRVGQALFGPRPLPDSHYWPGIAQ